MLPASGTNLDLDRAIGLRMVRADAGPMRTVYILTSIVILFACLDLMGWWIHIPIFTSVLPHYATMKPNTALSLGLLAFSLLCQASAGRRGRTWETFAIAAAALALLVSGLSFFEYVTGNDFGIDQLLATIPGDRFVDPAGRMSRGTSVGLLLTAIAALVLDRLPRLSLALVLTVSFVALSGLFGFVLGAGPLIGVPWLRSVAVHTAAGLLLLQAALIAVRPEREPMCSLLHYLRQEGRKRYLLFGVTLLPVLVALPVLGGMRKGMYDAPFAISLILVLLVMLQTLILWQDNAALQVVESRLRASDAQSSRILQSIGDAVIVTDAVGRVTRMNPVAEELTGWRLHDALGRPLKEVFHIVNETTRQLVESPAEKVMRLGSSVGLANHTLLYRRDGTESAIDDSGAPIRGDDGELTGIVVVFRSIDERKLAETALLRSEKLAAVGRLSATIAHEINNPLEAVTNLIFLARNSDDPAEIPTFLDTAEQELRRVSVITNQTLRFHRQSLTPQTVLATALLDEILQLYQGRMITPGIVIERRDRPAHPVQCFDGEIRQVLNNLIANAMDAMPHGGRIFVRSREATDWRRRRRGILLTVADTGSGISAQNLKKIFDPFFSTKGAAGNGLGLWVSQEIMLRHDGMMRVRSSRMPGHSGTVFTLFLPFEHAARAAKMA